jgi:hypothetical protein
MASSQEIAQIEAINAGLTALNNTLNTTSEKYLKIVKTIDEGTKSIKDNAATLENLNAAKKKTNDETTKQDALDKQLAASEKKLKDTEDSRLKTIIENRIKTQEATQALKDKIKANEGEEGSLVAMRLQLKELTDAYDKSGTRTKAATDEINKLSREIGVAEAATNRHSRGVGGYADQLGKLPGPIGQAATGIKGFVQQLWTLTSNPIVAVIALIVGAFVGLYKIFVSTASGAEKIKEIFASLHAIMNVLRERIVHIIEGFKALFQGKFKEAADDFKDSVKGISDELLKAASAAAELARQQNELNKQMAYHVSEVADEEKAIQKYLMLSKDLGQSDKDRIEDLKTAMDLSKKKSEQDVKFAQKQFDIDVGNAALKANIDQKTLGDWIKMNTDQQSIALESSKTLQNAYNLLGGADAVKALEESYAKVQAADQAYYQENKRTTSQLSTLLKDLITERITAAEVENNKQIAIINQRHIDTKSSEAQYQEDLLNQERIFANKKLAIYKDDSAKKDEETIKVQQKEIENNIKTKDLLLKTQSDLNSATSQNILDQYDREKAIENSSFENKVANLQKELIIKDHLSEDEIQINENINKTIEQEALAHKIKIGEINLKQTDEKLKIINAGYKEQLAALDDELSKEEITIEQYNDRKKKIEEDQDKAIVDFKKKYGIYGDTALKDEIKLFKESKEYALLSEEEKQQALKNIRDKYAKKDIELKKQVRDKEIEFASEVVNGIFKLNSAKLDREMSDLEKEKNAKLSNENLTATQKKKINDDYDKKEGALKTKQAKAEKLQSLFTIALDTAKGIMNATSLFQPELIPWVVAMGLLEAGLVAAQPIPKYKLGTQSAKERGLFGESGRELMIPLSGTPILAEKPTYFEGSKFKGAKIYSNPETERLIGMTDRKTNNYTITDERLLNEMTLVRKAILSKPVAIFDRNYKPIGQGTSQHQIIYLNRLIRN